MNLVCLNERVNDLLRCHDVRAQNAIRLLNFTPIIALASLDAVQIIATTTIVRVTRIIVPMVPVLDE